MKQHTMKPILPVAVDIHSEEDIELLPPESTTTDAYIATATQEAMTDDELANRNCNSSNISSSSSSGNMGTVLLYRSKCHFDDIPEIARGMTWNERFYEVNDNHGATPNIIAAFDIDRTIYDQSTFSSFKWYILAPLVSLCIFPVFIIFPVLAIIMAIYYSTILAIYLSVHCNRHEAKIRIKCRHVAISTRGIFIDEVAAPGSYDIMCRNIILYGDIKKCNVVSEYNPIFRTMFYKVAISTKDDRIVKSPEGTVVATIPTYIVGMKKQQKFVDIVNAMVERHTQSTTFSSTIVPSSDVVYEVDGLL